MTRIKQYFIYACISSTLVILINAALTYMHELGLIKDYGMTITAQNILMLSSLCFIACTLLYFADMISYPTITAKACVHILIIILTVLGIGIFVYKIIPFSLLIIGVVLVTIVITYGTILGIEYIKNESDAQKINEKLHKIRSKSNE